MSATVLICSQRDNGAVDEISSKRGLACFKQQRTGPAFGSLSEALSDRCHRLFGKTVFCSWRRRLILQFASVQDDNDLFSQAHTDYAERLGRFPNVCLKQFQ